jgi:hypothetical protein
LTEAKFGWDYDKIAVGMTLSEVETLIGPGTEIDRSSLPKTHRLKAGVHPNRVGPQVTVVDHDLFEIVPVVDGDVFHRWTENGGGSYVILGFRNGRVCDKWYWEPSL